jgi:dihydropteroate synthase
MSNSGSVPQRLLFVTGRLAEFALRRVLDDLALKGNFCVEVAVLPISVAALMTPKWVARQLEVPLGIDRVVLPGHCRGDLSAIEEKAGVPVCLGPEDLRDLPRWLGQDDDRLAGYGGYSIEILAEINHAPRLTLDEFLQQASKFMDQGADRIDVGCDPGGPWLEVGTYVKALVDRGWKVSVDSFDPVEVGQAVKAGADLVLSVNATNRRHALDWGVEVVAIPDSPGSLDGLAETIEYLEKHAIRYRIDPILEPIGFGFAASLVRYAETRKLWPDAPMLMGIGNLTELTDVDSSGVNTLLAGFCEELGVTSVLTTAVINWARSSVVELDLARRLVHHAVTRKTLPKRVEPRLILLRDDKPPRFGPEGLAELASRVKDPNWRIYAEDGRIYAFNNAHFLVGTDPFVIFEQMKVDDASHAFYLGHELMKAKTALTLNKAYRQDQALDWGFLTEPEVSHRSTRLKPSSGFEGSP